MLSLVSKYIRCIYGIYSSAHKRRNNQKWRPPTTTGCDSRQEQCQWYFSKPKNRLGHPEISLFSISNKIFSGSKYQKKKLFNFEKGSTGQCIRWSSTSRSIGFHRWPMQQGCLDNAMRPEEWSAPPPERPEAPARLEHGFGVVRIDQSWRVWTLHTNKHCNDAAHAEGVLHPSLSGFTVRWCSENVEITHRGWESDWFLLLSVQ